MKIEEIWKEWEKDNSIDTTDLSSESIRTPKLHNKYFRIYMEEGLKLRKMREELKEFKQHKIEWYRGKMSEEDIRDYGWKPAPDRNYLNSEIPGALDSDKDMIEKTLRIGVQEEKVAYLESIIRMINNRGFQIKNIIDFERFRMGG